jgi:hypothetical protein
MIIYKLGETRVLHKHTNDTKTCWHGSATKEFHREMLVMMVMSLVLKIVEYELKIHETLKYVVSSMNVKGPRKTYNEILRING